MATTATSSPSGFQQTPGGNMPMGIGGFENPQKGFFTQEQAGRSWFDPSLLFGQSGGAFSPTGLPIPLAQMGAPMAAQQPALPPPLAALMEQHPLSTQLWQMGNPALSGPNAALFKALGAQPDPRQWGLGAANPFHWGLGQANPFNWGW